MKLFAKYASSILSVVAAVVLTTTASIGWVHNPEVPQELLKKQ